MKSWNGIKAVDNLLIFSGKHICTIKASYYILQNRQLAIFSCTSEVKGMM